jgi:4-hydroxy-2-oxoheptanedioate aldolase
MATPGVDGCWIGPADLALSMGIHPRDMLNDDRHARALERVLEACRNTGKIPGFAAFHPDDAKRRAEQGFLYLTAGSDIGFMMAGANAGLKTLGLKD